MSDAELRQMLRKLPAGEHFKKSYVAIEGDLRLVSEDEEGREYRYRVNFCEDGTVKLERF